LTALSANVTRRVANPETGEEKVLLGNALAGELTVILEKP